MQTEMFQEPPRQRVRLVEAEPRAVVPEVTDLTGIRVFPAEVVSLGYPDGLKSQWYDAEEQMPWQDGFYEIGFGEGPQTAWYCADHRTFYLPDGRLLIQGSQRFVWRGALELLGRRRRKLLD